MQVLEEHYDTPWEFLARPTSVRLSVCPNAENTLSNDTPQGSPSVCSSSSFVNQLVNVGNSAVDARRKPSSHNQQARDESSKRRRPSEEVYLEQNMNRVEAEKRLESKQLGDYLLRTRGEGSAALSLRATKGVVHIKIEWNGEKWVIGEGPLFRSINSAISFYRRHPLPIRGADHLVLKRQLKPV